MRFQTMPSADSLLIWKLACGVHQGAVGLPRRRHDCRRTHPSEVEDVSYIQQRKDVIEENIISEAPHRDVQGALSLHGRRSRHMLGQSGVVKSARLLAHGKSGTE